MSTTPSTPAPAPPEVIIQPAEADSSEIETTASALPPISTPAPPRDTSSNIPNAPGHAPPAKGLPLSTPTSSVTPAPARLVPGVGALDLTEFDPYATPAPASTSTSKIEEPVTPAKAPLHEREMAEGASTSSSRPRTPNTQPTQTQAQILENEPPFNFSGFLKDLRMKSAEPIARYLKSFLSNFAKKPFTVNEQIKLIHDFLSFISEKMALVEPWRSQSSSEFDNALEAMEKLVMNRLYNYTFTPQLVPSQPITTDDLERDAVFAQRVRLFGWVREKHLDVPEGEASQGFIGFAEQELLKINHYKAPRDKMICILNACKVIFGLIRNVYGAEATGADAFVPILIFVVLQANPENMLSNIEYISRFRSASKLQGEAGYYLSSLSGAIAFIETMDASSLSNITQSEFEKNVENAIQQLPPSPTSSRTHSSSLALPQRSNEISPFSATAEGEEPARPLSLTTSLQALDGTRKFFQRTGNLAQEAVSKPLNAIGKILEGIQTPGSTTDDRSEDGSEDERQDTGQGNTTTPQSRDVFRTRRSQLNRDRAGTPESPSSSRYSHLGLGGQDDYNSNSNSNSMGLSLSRPTTPSSEMIQDFSAIQLQSTLDESQQAYEINQTHQANVQTLHQMFPALDEEIVEAVLQGCGEDLGLAIDRLLEM